MRGRGLISGACGWSSAEEEKERKEKEAADEKKRIDDLLAGVEKIDVSKGKDKGVIKQIIQEGEVALERTRARATL